MVSIRNDKILLRFDQGYFLLDKMNRIRDDCFHFFLDHDRINETASNQGPSGLVVVKLLRLKNGDVFGEDFTP